MGGTASTHLEGDGGCYSVKCRSAPLSVNDRAVLRVTKQELRVLSHVTLNALHDATQDADRDILLRLQWPDIAAVALAGRFLSVTEAPNHGAARPTVHLFKLQAAVNAAALVNLVRAHSEWRATRPFLEAGALPLSRSSSLSLHGTPRRSTSEGQAQRRSDDIDSAWNSPPASAAAPPPKPPVRWGSSDSASAPLGWATFGDGGDAGSATAPPPLPLKVNTWSVEPPPSSYFVAQPGSADSTPCTSASRGELLYRQYSGGVGPASFGGDAAPPQSGVAAFPPMQPLRAPPPPPAPLIEL